MCMSMLAGEGAPGASVPLPSPVEPKKETKRKALTNGSIRQAVEEFRKESADFNSPVAERKWGPIAEWDVSQVTNMAVRLLAKCMRAFLRVVEAAMHCVWW